MDREIVTLTLPPGGTDHLMEALSDFDFQFAEVAVGDDVATLGDIQHLLRRMEINGVRPVYAACSGELHPRHWRDLAVAADPLWLEVGGITAEQVAESVHEWLAEHGVDVRGVRVYVNPKELLP